MQGYEKKDLVKWAFRKQLKIEEILEVVLCRDEFQNGKEGAEERRDGTERNGDWQAQGSVAQKVQLSSTFLAIIRTEREGAEKKRLGGSIENSPSLEEEQRSGQKPALRNGDGLNERASGPAASLLHLR